MRLNDILGHCVKSSRKMARGSRGDLSPCDPRPILGGIPLSRRSPIPDQHTPRPPLPALIRLE